MKSNIYISLSLSISFCLHKPEELKQMLWEEEFYFEMSPPCGRQRFCSFLPQQTKSVKTLCICGDKSFRRWHELNAETDLRAPDLLFTLKSSSFSWDAPDPADDEQSFLFLLHTIDFSKQMVENETADLFVCRKCYSGPLPDVNI